MNTMDNLIFDTDLDSNTSNGGTVFRKSRACARFSKYGSFNERYLYTKDER